MSAPTLTPILIANGTSLSGAVNISLTPGAPLALIMPAAWTTAGLSFQVSYDGTTFGNLYTLASLASTEYVITAPALGETIELDPTVFKNVVAIKVRSGTSGTAVNQGADRTLTLVEA